MAKSLVDANVANQGVSTGKNFRFLVWVCHQVVYVTLSKALHFSASCFLIGFLSWTRASQAPAIKPSLTPPFPPTAKGTPSPVDSILERSPGPAQPLPIPVHSSPSGQNKLAKT